MSVVILKDAGSKIDIEKILEGRQRNKQRYGRIQAANVVYKRQHERPLDGA